MKDKTHPTNTLDARAAPPPPSNPSSCLILDPTADLGDLYDAVAERLTKIEHILIALTANDNHENLDGLTIGNALWALSSLVAEASEMHMPLYGFYQKALREADAKGKTEAKAWWPQRTAEKAAQRLADDPASAGFFLAGDATGDTR